FGAHIDFAYPSFRWDNEASDKAHVHCVIVGFSCDPALAKAKRKKLFAQEGCKEVDNINAYLVAANNEFINNRKLPLCDVPLMTTGNRPADGGFLIIEQEDYDDFIAKEPDAVPFIKKFVGSTEFINNKKRYCLWLVDASPAQMRKMPLVMKRIEGCKQDRLNSPDKGRQQLADMPHLFREIQNPNNYLIIPKVSSERRPYIPIGYMDKETIASDLVFIIPSASLYHFGVLTSWVHMAWMRAVCGRLKSDYRYSKDVVYNNFPWPEADASAVAAISETAQAILDARAAYPDSSLADLYDDTLMPPALRRAHRNNDRAVLRAYGFPTNDTFTESDCVARLFQLYADWGK
ncbi:MAG: methylase, partial [Bacteroidales bacterium]|nr:methylase [Bacteroidales bacterium]